ncbi:MAG TPA: TldD/PmbA family protein [Polyangiales bacterium]
MSLDLDRMLSQAQDIVRDAQRRGASLAECTVQEGAHLSAKVRLKETELVEEAGSRSIGLRVMLGQKVAVTYSSDFTKAGLSRLVEDAIELAELSQPDPFAGAPDPSLLSKAEEHAQLDLFDPSVDGVDAGEAVRRAREGEQAALDHDPRITNSEGATFTRVSGASALVTSGGFHAANRGTYASIVVSPVADDEGGKKRSGYYWSSRRHLAQLEPADAVGREAAKRTLQKLGARKVESQEIPVIFDPDAARSILGLLAGCISGGSIWRRSSYLLDRLDTEVGSELVSVVDDPLIPRGPGSRPYDGEGLLSRRNTIVERGVLKSYQLDTYSGKKLNLPSTANAARGSSGGVGVSSTNFQLLAGSQTPEQILRDTPKGLYVTSMMGFGFNAVTGDFSRGASGFWVENGELAFPVSEVTISLNLDQLLKRIDAVGNDLDLKTSIAAPTFRVGRMTLAGK